MPTDTSLARIKRFSLMGALGRRPDEHLFSLHTFVVSLRMATRTRASTATLG